MDGAIRSGPRSALPRGLTSDRRLTRGDLVVAEFGANVGGYHAMAGCTFFMGDPLREIVTLVETCLRAQDAARAAAVVGAEARAVDRAARDVFAAADRADALRHRTGHGIGLDARERPWLTEYETTALAADMVVTIEPAIYQPGRLGVRNIETIAVADDGPRVLNQRAGRWRELGARLKEF
jgi:Xaa-Pro aminopeptidase